LLKKLFSLPHCDQNPFTSSINASGAEFCGDFAFTDYLFERGLDFTGAIVYGKFRFDRCTSSGAFHAPFVTFVGGSAARARGATFHGNVDFSFSSTDAALEFVDCEYAKLFSANRLHGDVHLPRCQFTQVSLLVGQRRETFLLKDAA
jgi:hypothetical protein